MKKHAKKIIIACMAIAVIVFIFAYLYQNTADDTWSDKLTDQTELEQYIDFYIATHAEPTSEEGVFYIRNKTEQEMRTGEFYVLQKKVFGKWYDVNGKDGKSIFDFVAVGYPISPGSEYGVTVNWEEHYGKLPKGTYRIIKDADLTIDERYHKSLTFLFACEFRI